MDVGYILSTIPPIVENIFIFLNKSELDVCSEVCELWKRVAETEKNRRRDIVFFFQGLHCSLHDKIHSNCQECSLNITRDIESDLSIQLKKLKVKPQFCLTFVSNYFINNFEQLFPSFQHPSTSQAKRPKEDDIDRNRAYLKAAIQAAVGQYLPEKCKTVFCVASGIIGCHRNAIPLEIEEGCGISGIMIPHVPGLQIYNFPIDDQQCDVSKLLPKDIGVKCLLVFITLTESFSLNRIVQNCVLKENSKIALGGAVIDKSESYRGNVIAFCGQSVEAASIIIKPNDKKEAELEKKLKLFQETGLLKDRCFAFMFACVTRGFYIYGEYNLESSVFHKLYPNIPLIGVFGNEEIGTDYLPNVGAEKHNQSRNIGKLAVARCGKRYRHRYATIFVLVSIKL